ncbi:MAG: hypothetical protein HKN09_03890 [Saprospiraceae bacterium]|nr:hypothetical protein [Saprospiraceae bacterium]
MISIYTGAVHTGKTTSLRAWAKESVGTGGFLTPDRNGSRVFENIATKEVIPFQVDSTEHAATLEVGPYVFLKSTFQSGIKVVAEQIDNALYDTIIIDELGKLELKGEGFAQIGYMIAQDYLNKHFIVIVRDSLVHQIAQKFEFPCYSVIRDTTKLLPQ